MTKSPLAVLREGLVATALQQAWLVQAGSGPGPPGMASKAAADLLKAGPKVHLWAALLGEVHPTMEVRPAQQVA